MSTMGQLTLVHCLICGEAMPYPWKKEDRAAHLATHLIDSFMKVLWERDHGDSIEEVTQIGKDCVPGSISDEWKKIREDWDVDYYENNEN